MQSATTLLTVQITRAWVLGGNRQADALKTELDLPTASGTGRLADELMSGLRLGLDSLNDLAQHKIVLKRLKPGEEEPEVSPPRPGKKHTTVQVPGDPTRTTPAALAKTALLALCELLANNWHMPLHASELAAFVSNAAKIEGYTHIKTIHEEYLRATQQSKPLINA